MGNLIKAMLMAVLICACIYGAILLVGWLYTTFPVAIATFGLIFIILVVFIWIELESY